MSSQNEATEPEPPRVPLITAAKLKIVGQRQSRTWDLYAEGLLIGWTPEDPARETSANFTPSCWGYGSGQHVIVSYSPTLTIA